MAHYYDINEILMEEENITSTFKVGASEVAVLDPCAETSTVEQGAKVELPFWLAQYLRSKEVVTIDVPPCFDKKTRKEVQADVACVDLRSRCPYFYELGCKIAPMIGDRTIGSFLLVAFRGRYQDILRKAHSTAFVVAPKFLTLLTKEETQLYEAAKSSMTAYKKWRVGGTRFERVPILKKRRKPND
ncbi:hypothetical protein GIB67_027494 [Kingdonia uniflora]|uniref:GINS subunit domain-containing protein n=1 Tax=Kingdonia uniflora TaxID=39325 RepID=A0A7J7MFJ6_9MAGN|nr:hypothetical protein GIB67_027494 [Kingdonia uniflora]